MPKKQPKDEAVSGTYAALREELEAAVKANFSLFDAASGEDLYVRDIFIDEDRVIVRDWERYKLYRADWSRNEDDEIQLSDVVEVEEETSYVDIAESATTTPANLRAFTETVQTTFEVVESAGGNPFRVRATGITAGVVNANGRRYPRKVLQQAISDLQAGLNESRVQGRLVLTGEAEHPSDKGGRSNLLETVVKWDVLGLDETGQVKLEGTIIPTSKGRDVIEIVNAGVPVGISQRAYGESRIVKEGGRRVEEVTALSIAAYDLVMEPSDPNGGIDQILESKQRGEKRMDEELKKLLESPGFQAAVDEAVQGRIDAALRAKDEAKREQMLREALGAGEGEDLLAAARKLAEKAQAANRPQAEPENGAAPEGNTELREALGLDEGADVIAEARRILEKNQRLEEAERKREVVAYLDETVGGIEAYPERIRARLREAVRADEPATIDEAKDAIAKHRKVFDGIVADLALEAKGMDRGLRIVGSVLENETGVPEFARVSHEISESLAKRGQATLRDWNRPALEMSPAERFTMAILEAFDKANQAGLLAEAKLFEAEQVGDLSLPYSVSRAIIMEAFPALVAANVFDFGVADASPTKIFFEQYTDETGVEGAVTDEDVEIAALGAWVDLANARVQFGTVVVEPNGGGTPLVENSDYVIDYAEGRILALSGGAMTAGPTTYDVDYKYDAIRKGEMQPIERGKQQLTSKTLEIAADRLAVQVSSEAVEFSRSQLGYDALSRAIAGVIGRVRRKIDKDIFYLALSSILTIANNSGGIWSSTTPGDTTYQEHLDALLRCVGAAKVKVSDRYYSPNALVCSEAIADMLGNSDKWQRPDVNIDAAGSMGRVKGLPIWAVPTEQFTDAYLMVVNRELVMHRVFRAMVLKGPFPTYDVSGGTSKLIAADQYYVEEFNGTDAPVPQKGAYVKIS